MGKGVLIQPSFYEAMKVLPDAERLILYDCICEYSLNGIEPKELSPFANSLFSLMKPNIDSSNKRYKASVENGKKGGPPKGNQNARKPKNNLKTTRKQPKNKQDYDLDSDFDLDIDSELDLDKECDSDNTGETAFRPHGEYNNVLLTNEELEKLQEQFPDDWQERIDNLSEYIASNGKNYASHYATIRRWAKKDQAEKKQKGSYYYPDNPCNHVKAEDYENDSENPF